MSVTARIVPQPDRAYHLVTRSDMDGLVCAVLLKSLNIIKDITFAHPKDVQDGLVRIGPENITTNLPYTENAFLVFDHHASEIERIGTPRDNHVIDPSAPSAARVVYNYFGGASRFPGISPELMAAVDKADSASFTKEDILNPEGWVLLSFLMDARTGLGRFRDFNISNYQLMMELIDTCTAHKSIQDILALPDVRERVDLYFEHQLRFREQLERCATVHKNMVVLDLRKEETIWAGNRFMVYALFPQCNVSCHILWGKNRQNTVLAVGKSILNRACPVHIGNLMLQYGGGGHDGAGTCQVPNLQTEEKIQNLILSLTSDQEAR